MVSTAMGKQNARDRILHAAGELFFERGYSCVGINEIIARSETAKATFYHHFPTKEALCEAWLRNVHDRSEHSRKEILEAEGDAIGKVEDYFESLRTYLESKGFRGCPYSNTASVASEKEESLAHQIEEHKLSLRKFFHCLAGQVTASGSRTRQLGDALFLLYSGATSEAQNLKSMWPVDAARRAAIDLCRMERDHL